MQNCVLSHFNIFRLVFDLLVNLAFGEDFSVVFHAVLGLPVKSDEFLKSQFYKRQKSSKAFEFQSYLGFGGVPVDLDPVVDFVVDLPVG